MSHPARLDSAELRLDITPEQQELIELELDICERIERARYDFNEYIELTAVTDKGRPMKQSWLHRTWVGHCFWCWGRGLHPVVMAPWGHGKSVQLAVEMPVWLLGRNRQLRTLVITNVDDNSKLRVAAAYRIIRSRRELQAVFPGLRLPPGKPSTFAFSVVGGSMGVDPSLASFGIFGSGTSRRSDFQVHDDIVDENNALKNPALRPQVIEHVDNKWLPRLEPPCMACACTGIVGGLAAMGAGEHESCRVCSGTGGGRSVGIGTAWHVEDYWHNRRKIFGFCTLVQKVTESMDGYESEVFGVPEGLAYPTLEQLVLYGSPAAHKDRLLERLGLDCEAMRRSA